MVCAPEIRRRLAVAVTALLFAYIAAPVLAEETPQGGPELLRWVFLELYGVNDEVSGETISDLRTPAVPVNCSETLQSVWEFCEYQGAAAPKLTRCSVTGPELYESCDAADSSLPLDLDDPIGGHSGEFYWQGLDASRGTSCGNDEYGAMILANTNPPQNPFVAHLQTGFNVSIVSEYDDLMPDGGGSTFQTYSYVAVAPDGNVAFTATGSGARSGVYRANPLAQTVVRVVDNTMLNPGGAQNYGPPTSVRYFNWDETPGPPEESFIAWSDGNGIYITPADLSSAPTRIVATGDSYAAGRAVKGGYTQLSFARPNRIVFKAQSQTFQDGIYSVALDNPHVLRRHADNETTYGGGAFSFGPLQNPSGAGDTFFFEAFTPAFVYRGAFVDVVPADGEVQPLLLRNDPLGGKTVQTVVVNPKSAVHAGKAAMLVYFTDNTGGVYSILQVVFANGFESGNTDGWDLTVP